MNDATPGASVAVSSRAIGLFVLMLIAVALGCRLAGDGQASTAALKLLSATLVIGIVPGALATMICRPRPHLTILDVIGVGTAISFGFVQLLTILAISFHVSAALVSTALVVGSALLAARAVHRPSGSVVVSADEIIVVSMLCLLGVFLYDLGSPFDWYEDQVHVAIVRRLTELEAPRLDNLYFAPGIVYTYPFPGTHYFMALVARLSDLDPLFVYHKLRFFWGPAALVMLHLAARAVFGGRAVATGVTVTAVALVCSGAFGMVPGFDSGWGQLAPFSHASDVAMTVLLPALLVVAFGYLLAESVRERAFFLVATAMLVLMLTIVHIRELVQFASYIGCFLLVTMAVHRFRPYRGRTAALLALALVVGTAYTLWQAQVATLVGDIVGSQRAALGSVLTSNSIRALIFTPAPTLLGEFLLNTDQISEGLTPLFLFAGPTVLWLFPRRPLVWLVIVSTAVYLMVMTVPLLAIPYIYVTYFEILFTPVRNVIFFVYLLAGALVYAAVVALTRVDPTRVSLLGVGALAGALALLVSLCLNQSVSGFSVPLIAAYVLGLLVLSVRPLTHKTGLRSTIGVGLVVMGLVSLFPERQPVLRVTSVSVRWSAGFSDVERVALEQRFSLTAGEPGSNRSEEVNVWNYSLDDLSEENVRALVTHPSAVDTNEIDRSRFTVSPQPPRSDDPYLGVESVAWLQYPGWGLFLVAAAFVWMLGFVVPAALASSRGRDAVDALQGAMSEPFYKRALPFALFIVPFVLWSARPTLSPLPVAPDRTASARTPRAVVTQVPCVTIPQSPAPFSEDILDGGSLVLPARSACPPDYDVIEWARSHVPLDAVFAIDRWNPHLPSVFMPQQVVVFPQLEASFEREQELFGTYYRFYDERIRTSRLQPFFNTVETPSERTAFIEALGVTHVLVGPAYHDEMRPVLDGLSGQYALRYDRAGWAIYEVIGTASEE